MAEAEPDFEPMEPPGAGVQFHDDEFDEEGPPPPPGAGGNFRMPLRGRAGRHRHTQSSAAVLHRSAYSTGSLGGAIQNEYARSGRFLPLPPPNSIDEAGESPASTPRRGGSRSPNWQSKGEEILGGFKGGGGGGGGGGAAALPPPGGRAGPGLSLTLDLEDTALEQVNDEEAAVRGRLVNKFTQEVMRSYPPELAAMVAQVGGPGRSPSHRRPRADFVLEDLDTNTWMSLDPEADAELSNALQTIRASAAASFEASRRSKQLSSGSPDHKSGGDLQKESKELEMELIRALETEVKGLRSERQRMEVKYARMKEKNSTLLGQMRGVKDELESLKSLPAVAEERHRRDSLAAGGSANTSMDMGAMAAAAAGGAESEAALAKIATLEHDVQEKALALKSVRKQFVDTLIKQQRAEKINEELRKDLNESAGEADNLRELLDSRQQQLDDNTEELETLRLHADREKQGWEQEKEQMVKDYEERMMQMKEDMAAALAQAKQQMAQVQATSESMQRQNSADMNAALVKEMGKMLKEAIEKSTKKSTQVETAMNNGSDVTVDTKDMFKCVTCSYINASIRLVCHNCGSKRFADLRNEKERKHIRKQWVNSLVNMYLNMLEEILKTPRGEKVVQGEARHSSRAGEAITGPKIKQAEEKIQRMLEAAATQKGRQKFSEVYPKLESSATDGSESEGQPTPPPKMKRYVKSIVNANKGKAAFAKRTPSQSEAVAAGSLVYAKWYGPEREKYPDWYEAQVAQVDGADSYVIKYQNGTLCSGVPRKDIRARRSHS